MVNFRYDTMKSTKATSAKGILLDNVQLQQSGYLSVYGFGAIQLSLCCGLRSTCLFYNLAHGASGSIIYLTVGKILELQPKSLYRGKK